VSSLRGRIGGGGTLETLKSSNDSKGSNERRDVYGLITVDAMKSQKILRKEKKVKKILMISLTVVLALSFGLTGCEGEGEPDAIVIKCAHTVPATESSALAWIEWGDMISEEWAGMKAADEPGINFTYFWSMSLLGPTELYDGVKDGTADMVFYPIGVNPGLLPMNEIFRLPLLFNSNEEAVCAAAEAFQDGTVFVDEIEGDGDVKFFSAYMMPPYHLHTASANVTLPADVTGLTIGAEGDFLDFIAATNATPEETSVDQLAEKYNLGLIDGNIAHFPVQFAFGALDFTPHHTLFGSAGIAMVPCVWLLNPDTWDSLPSGLQDLIMSTSDDFAVALKAGSDGFEGFVLGTQCAGHAFNELTEPQLDEWRALVVPQHDAWAAQSVAHNDTYNLLQSIIAGCP
jgi:TRAP-type C4-dicarboxylate transport system substrate-binding protein